jgi:hypothetical protein
MFNKTKALLGTLGVAAASVAVNSHAAVSSVLPSDIATDQATIAGDVAGAGAVVIAVALTAMGVRKVIGMF